MNANAHTTTKHACSECGAPMRPTRVTEEFCSAPCRKKFNNRRMTRGAQLYDLFMVMRHQRGLAKAHGVWNLMCRLAMYWREEDMDQRENRRSWKSPRAALDSTTWARATIVNRDVLGQHKRR